MSAQVDRDVAIRERLEKIAARHGGRLTPEAVVEDARDPESPLHGEFNWNLEHAAYAHWLEVARRLIRSVEVRIVVHELELSAPIWIRDHDLGREQGYLAVAVLRDDHARALREYQAACRNAVAVLKRAISVGVAAGLPIATLRRVIADIEGVATQAGFDRKRPRST
jgi:hypothetical protein